MSTRWTSLLLLTVSVPLLTAKPKDQLPHACVPNPSGGSLCLSDLRWTMYRTGFVWHERISGIFDNKPPDAIRDAMLKFSLFDKNDRVVQSAVVAVHLTILPGESCPFRVTVEEPEGTGFFRSTLYTKEALIETWNMSMASSTVEMQFPILFAESHKLGVRAYKKSHGIR